MGRHARIIPLSSVRYVLRDVPLRISEQACVIMATHVEQDAAEIVERAKKAALHKGKRTIDADDVQLAIRMRS